MIAPSKFVGDAEVLKIQRELRAFDCKAASPLP